MPKTKTLRRSKPGTREFTGYTVPDPNKAEVVKEEAQNLRNKYKTQPIPNWKTKNDVFKKMIPLPNYPIKEERKDP